jgi:3-oxoacyl-[acyl-carrier-protein] synthase II
VLFPLAKKGSPCRVVITGAGIVTGLGLGWRTNADGFRAGRNAFRKVTRFDVSRQRAQIAAEVDLPPTPPSTRLSRSARARLTPSASMLLFAAHEAWTQAGWQPGEDLPLVLGTTSGAMSLGEAYLRQAMESPRSKRRQPTRVIHYQIQREALNVCDAFGFSGPITIIANACASGANALGHAWELLRSGRVERVFAGGYDALCQLTFSGFDSLQALSADPCRPFDAHRNGLTLGEGAAMFALETLDSARRRNAEILGEITGYGASTDIHHLTQPHPAGDAAFAAMTAACAAATTTPEQVDYVNAHGTATVQNDGPEALAISRWAGTHATTLPVSSTKASIGHLLGGAGAVEAAVCLMALREQWLPPQIGTGTADPACAFPLVREPKDARINIALTNSFGFGGANASLLLRRWS